MHPHLTADGYLGGFPFGVSTSTAPSVCVQGLISIECIPGSGVAGS